MMHSSTSRSVRSRWLRSTAWWAAGCLVYLQACSLFVDLDALTGAAEQVDAGNAPDGPNGESSSGVGASSSSSGVAESDAAAQDGDAAPLAGFCAMEQPAHLLCADFDEGPVDREWTSYDMDPIVTVELDSLASSPPSSMRSAIRVNGDCKRAMLYAAYGGPYVGGKLAFDVRLGSAESPVASVAYIANIHAGRCDYLVQVLGDQTILYTQIDQGSFADTKSTPVFVPAGVWRRSTAWTARCNFRSEVRS